MRILLIFLCISGFLAKDIARTSWEIWFKVNQARIIAEKCENKDVPMMHCNGKCYLAKKLQKLEAKEQNHNSKTNPYGQSVKADWISHSVQPAQLAFADLDVQQDQFSCRTIPIQDYQDFIFHPPAF